MYKWLVNDFTIDALKDLIGYTESVWPSTTDTNFSYRVDETLFSINVVSKNYSGKEFFWKSKYLDSIEVENSREYTYLWKSYIIQKLLKIFRFEMNKWGFSKELDDE